MTKLCVHHVGGRGGSTSFPIEKEFEKDIISVLYEADSEAVDQIKKFSKRYKSKTIVLPFCVGESNKKTSFFVNYDPYTSSLYNFNKDYADYYFNCDNDYDYLFSEAMVHAKSINVDLVNLDYLMKTKKYPSPDFISLDAQGAEYDILCGARDTLSNVVGLVVEVELIELYKGQKIFGDICKLLSEEGFEFIKFLFLGEAKSYRAPIGMRGEGNHIYADALFLKRVDSINSIGKIDMLKKLSFVSILFNQFDYGTKCLIKLKDIEKKKNKDKEGLVYYTFLDELYGAILKMEKKYPKTFKDLYPTFEKSNNRFKVFSQNAKLSGVWMEIKLLLVRSRIIVKTYIFFLRIYNNFRVFLRKNNPFVYSSQVEKILKKYGLKKQAKTLFEKRIGV